MNRNNAYRDNNYSVGNEWKLKNGTWLLGNDSANIRSINPSTRFYAVVIGKILDANTFARNNGFRRGVRNKTWADAVEAETKIVKDPLTGAIMNKKEPWDTGHRPELPFSNRSHKMEDKTDYFIPGK